jgi:hypothetical protein
MLKTIAKLFAYKKAPKRTFAVLHPARAVKWFAGLFVIRTLWGMVSGGKK